ncbi:MAG: GPW/gp25 family protein [Algoriphagus sp.]|jgi:phage baseplate assembly protein W|nr:GPW/gp25 family protein [Algoriphagus sp.]
MAEDKSFLGRGWGYPVTFNKVLGKVNMVSDEVDIRQSLEIYLATQRGERLLRLKYGSVMHEYMFERASYSNLNFLCETLKNDMRIYEPRIIVHKVKVDTKRVNDGVVHFMVDYEIQSTNVRDNIVFPFYILEGTNIPE